MLAKYVNGAWKASRFNDSYVAPFGVAMYGTFNAEIDEKKSIYDYKPCKVYGDKSFWLVKLTNKKDVAYGYVVRFATSKQKIRVYEIISKEMIPKSFKKDTFELEILEKWDDEKIKKWADKQYWFQSFLWSPKRTDPDVIWDELKKARLSGARVLDVGCNYGLFSFLASKMGAYVCGFDKDKRAIETARIINEHIEMQDVKFSTEEPSGSFEYIFYLSVHHQIDPTYKHLAEKLDELRKKCMVALFVELIRPPMFGDGVDVDSIVGGTKLVTYKHKLRGERTIYRIDV